MYKTLLHSLYLETMNIFEKIEVNVIQTLFGNKISKLILTSNCIKI